MWDVYTPHSPYINVQRQIQQTVQLATVQLYQAKAEISSITILGNTLLRWALSTLQWACCRIVNNKGNTIGFRGRRSQGRSIFVETTMMEVMLLPLPTDKRELWEWEGSGTPCSGGARDFQYLSLDWHKPYWAIYEALAYNGGGQNSIAVEFSM